MGLEAFIKSSNIRLDQQLRFTAEIDKMTSILRRTMLVDGSRRENDAEHSWHIAVMTLIFEEYAADKLFAQLPSEQGAEIRSFWEEFDAMQTADAKYAACMDRLQPFLHNTLTGGHTWVESGTARPSVEKRMAIIKDFMPEVYKWVEKNLDNAVAQGWLKA